MLKTPGLICGWKMDEKDVNGYFKDISGSNHALIPTSLDSVAGKIGNCAYWPATTDGAQTTTLSASLDALTYAFWFKGAPNSYHQRIICCGMASSPYTTNMRSVHLTASGAAYGGIPANSLGFFDYSNNNRVYVTWNSSWSNTWIHICVTMTNTGVTTIYVNGQSVASSTVTIYNLGANITTINIGCSTPGYYGCIGSCIDEIFIYNKVLNINNMKRLMNSFHPLN